MVDFSPLVDTDTQGVLTLGKLYYVQACLTYKLYFVRLVQRTMPWPA